MIKLVAFDWNGTLLADTHACIEAVNQVMKVFGRKPLTFYQYLQIFEVPVNKMYQGIGLRQDFILKNSKKIAETFHSHYEARAANLRTRRGAKEVLGWLGKQKIECIIFSNHLKGPIEFQLRRLKIESYFSAVLANSHQDSAIRGRNKEKWLIYYVASKKLKPREVLVVGDTAEEIEIGKKIGAITVGLTGGNYTTARVKAARPDYLINNLREIIDIVKIY